MEKNMFNKKNSFPPIPDWEPNIDPNIEKIIEKFRYYTDSKKDFAVFKNGTCVLLPDGLSDEKAIEYSHETIKKIFSFHPDMNPTPMDDGNIAIWYNHPAINIVLKEISDKYIKEIDKNYLKALAKSEVIITPQGPNKFDAFGKIALFGRCYFFMDAKNPEIIKIIRK